MSVKAGDHILAGNQLYGRTLRLVTQELPRLGFATDVVTRHKAAAFSIFHDGIGWTWVDTTRVGVDAMELVSSGALDLMRAAQIAPRGIAKIAMGALDSYRGTDARVDDLIKRKADILKIVETYSGDGAFKVAVDKKAMRLTVRATGKTVSEVLPIGMMLPAAVVGFLESQAKQTPMMVEPPPLPPAQPATMRGGNRARTPRSTRMSSASATSAQR